MRSASHFMNQILIAEDEPRIAALLEKGLKKHGFETAIATDGSEALEMAAAGDFNLLLLDLGLPVKDGWEVLKSLRNKGKQLPIVIVSARKDDEEIAAGFEAGATDYITKPFRLNDLVARVRSFIR